MAGVPSSAGRIRPPAVRPYAATLQKKVSGRPDVPGYARDDVDHILT